MKVSEIKASLPSLKDKIERLEASMGNPKIVALGKTAEKALTLLQLSHFTMPHPSGLNRQLNDKNYVQEKLKGLKDYLADTS